MTETERLNNLKDEYLEHYGVLGMKWGVRKDPQKAYDKANKKLAKLDRKATKQGSRIERKQAKALKKQAKADSAILFKRRKAEKAAKATHKAMAAYRKQQAAEVKAYRWHQSMDKVFKNTKVKNLNPDYVALGNKYASKTINELMQNNTSMNSLQQIETYYRGQAKR